MPLIDPTEIDDRFSYHPPSSEAVGDLHDQMRHLLRAPAHRLNVLLPKSREASLALTALQEAMMWANAAIAIHGLPEGD